MHQSWSPGRSKSRSRGAGKARVNATESLTARSEGAGTITYAGDPKTVERVIEGVGRISRAP
jgi:hypothetical protein